MHDERRLIYDHERIAKWTNERLGHEAPALVSGLYRGIGLERGGEIIAGCVFSDYYPGGSIEMHVAGRGMWARPSVIAAAFRYAFEQCGARCVIARVADRNERCQRLLERLGFTLCGFVPNALPDDDLLLYALQRDQWRPTHANA